MFDSARRNWAYPTSRGSGNVSAMQTLTIRPMTPDDAAAVTPWMTQIELWRRYGLLPARATELLHGGIERGDIVLVADTRERQACAFAWCIPTGMFDRSPYLRWIAVQPGASGGGVGAALLDAVEDRAREADRDLFLLAADYNTGAQRFYERQGYRRVALLPDYVVAGVGELLYWKRLR